MIIDRFAELRENFIPLRHSELIQRLQEYCSFNPAEQADFCNLSDRLAAIFHIEHLEELLRIQELYDGLDPDSEIHLIRQSETQRNVIGAKFFQGLDSLLRNAHYHRLTLEQIKAAVSVGSRWGAQLDVDYDLFDRIEVYVRGYRPTTITRRQWKRLFRKETIQLPVFQRLILAFRLKYRDSSVISMNPECVYLKNFRDIPETDLEILLPGAKVRLSVMDRGKILIPTLSGIALTIYKIVRAAAVLTLASLAGVWGWILLVGALGAYIVRSVLGFIRTKDKYRFDLTRNLYLRNLDNNAGVLYRIFNEAEEQELCEAILGYTLLLEHQGSDGIGIKTLDDYAETFLFESTGIRVEFDQDDAMYKLARLRLANSDQQSRWKAVKLSEAAEILVEKWGELFQAQQRQRVRG